MLNGPKLILNPGEEIEAEYKNVQLSISNTDIEAEIKINNKDKSADCVL